MMGRSLWIASSRPLIVAAAQYLRALPARPKARFRKRM